MFSINYPPKGRIFSADFQYGRPPLNFKCDSYFKVNSHILSVIHSQKGVGFPEKGIRESRLRFTYLQAYLHITNFLLAYLQTKNMNNVHDNDQLKRV